MKNTECHIVCGPDTEGEWRVIASWYGRKRPVFGSSSGRGDDIQACIEFAREFGLTQVPTLPTA